MQSAFISLENIEKVLSFALAPSLIGPLKKEEKKQEQFAYTALYDAQGVFKGFVVEKEILYIGG